ncbi:MAG: Rrf2 family transcriptional regulator [Clostridia bacterium BRH_c25]|nr:MAG: Rrf2 family transcriptional regulator [Clostridia bacterium BRH_c25]
MKISTKGRYGLRAMVDLAVYSRGDHISLKSIAERQNISEGYLEQVFSILRKAGLLNSIKGAQGGYVLAEKPTNITVGAVLRVLEGNLSVIDEKSMEEKTNDRIEDCIREKVWSTINTSINEVVDKITLEELMDEYNKMANLEADMYYI